MSEPIKKSITVQCSLLHAFKTFTEKADLWWPPGHRTQSTSSTMILEGFEGGRFYEQSNDGNQRDFGRVLCWEPPTRLTYAWFLGSNPEQPTEVDIRFYDEDDHTRVEIIHRQAEMPASTWPNVSIKFHKGWDHVLEAFSHAATRET